MSIRMTYCFKKVIYCGCCGVVLDNCFMNFTDINHAYREAAKYNFNKSAYCGCQVEVVEKNEEVFHS